MKVLLIDDDSRCREALHTTIERLGEFCVSFGSPRAAVGEFLRNPYDLVITDLDMPEMDGIQVLRAVYSNRPGTRVVVVTGKDDEVTNQRIKRSGAYARLHKPINILDITRVIERVKQETD
ncbi:MAG: response regulator [Firmicutes bacterium]|nr:response regulator [Bacillota bacterium]